MKSKNSAQLSKDDAIPISVTAVIIMLHNVPSDRSCGKHDVKSRVGAGKLWLILFPILLVTMETTCFN